MLSEKYVYDTESESETDKIEKKLKKINLGQIEKFDFSLKLISKAKSKGGDRYEDENKEIVIYIPQEYSRIGSSIKQILDLNVNFKSGLKFKISNIAKNKGGDKYICESNINFNIYLPQKISRISNKIKEFIYINLI
jgi:hypothetical protein